MKDLKGILYYLIFFIILGFGTRIANFITNPIHNFLKQLWTILILGRNKAKEYIEWEKLTWENMLLGKDLEAQKLRGKEILSNKSNILFIGKNIIVILQLLFTSFIFAILTAAYNNLVHLDIYVLIGIFALVSWFMSRGYAGIMKIILYIFSYYYFVMLFFK